MSPKCKILYIVVIVVVLVLLSCNGEKGIFRFAEGEISKSPGRFLVDEISDLEFNFIFP